MYANDDIYNGPNDPTDNINPKIIGAFYINTQTAKLFVCTDNTINNNTWKICNPDVEIPEIPEIPIPKFNTSAITTKNPLNHIMENTWYHNTTNEIWFISSNSNYERAGIYVAHISAEYFGAILGDPDTYCSFENHWSVTAVVPKGYKFYIDFGGRGNASDLQWTRLSLSEITLPTSKLDPHFDLYQYIDRLKSQIPPKIQLPPTNRS